MPGTFTDQAERVLLVRARPFDTTVVGTPGFPYALGEVALGEITDNLPDAAPERRLASGAYRTGPTDTEPNLDFPARLTRAYRYAAAIEVDTDRAGAATSFGEIAFANADGARDGWVFDLAWDGHPVSILLGEAGWDSGDFHSLFLGVVEGEPSGPISEPSFSLRTLARRLADPVARPLYGGTGGTDGGEDLAGRPKPWPFGSVRNWAPPLVDSATLLYDLSFREIQDLTEVRDKGAVLDFDTTAGAGGQMVDVTIWDPTGKAGTCVWQTNPGRLRLAAAPAGDVTVDLQGDAVGTYVDRPGAIVRRLVGGAGALSDPGDLDTASFTAADAVLDYTSGWVLDTAETTYEREIEGILGGLRAFWVVTRQGLLRIGVLADPRDSAALETWTEKDIASLEFAGTVAPSWRRRVGGRRNWTVQTKADLAGTADEIVTRVAAYGDPLAFAVAERSDVKGQYLSPREVEVATPIASTADLATEALRQNTLFGRKAQAFKVRRRVSYRDGNPFVRELGDRVDLDYEETATGRVIQGNFLVLSVSESSPPDAQEFLVWGYQGAKAPTQYLDTSEPGPAGGTGDSYLDDSE